MNAACQGNFSEYHIGHACIGSSALIKKNSRLLNSVLILKEASNK